MHNSTEKHALKKIEKKVHNLDHNKTENNMDENEEFFYADCSIPDKTRTLPSSLEKKVSQLR